MTFLRKSGSLVVVWIKSLVTAAQCSFCSGSRSHVMNFATTCFMPRSCIKMSDIVGFGIPSSGFSYCTVSCGPYWLLPIYIQHSLVFCLVQAFQNMGHFQQILNHLWSICLCCIHCIVPESLNHPVSTEEYLSLMQNLTQICCSTHSVILNRWPHSTHANSMKWRLPLLLTSIVKVSLFTHAHSSWLSLVVRLHQCDVNDSHYFNNGWAFSIQTL